MPTSAVLKRRRQIFLKALFMVSIYASLRLLRLVSIKIF
jgi:hypothetical protein